MKPRGTFIPRSKNDHNKTSYGLNVNSRVDPNPLEATYTWLDAEVRSTLDKLTQDLERDQLTRVIGGQPALQKRPGVIPMTCLNWLLK